MTLASAGFLDLVQHKVQQSVISKKVYSACDVTSATVSTEPRIQKRLSAVTERKKENVVSRSNLKHWAFP